MCILSVNILNRHWICDPITHRLCGQWPTTYMLLIFLEVHFFCLLLTLSCPLCLHQFTVWFYSLLSSSGHNWIREKRLALKSSASTVTSTTLFLVWFTKIQGVFRRVLSTSSFLLELLSILYKIHWLKFVYPSFLVIGFCKSMMDYDCSTTNQPSGAH